MANEQNLRPGEYKFTLEEVKKGAEKSAEVRRQRKAFKEVFNALLSAELSPELAEALNEKSGALGIDTSMFTVAEYIGLAQVVKAVSGDTSAFTTIRDTIGEKPADKQEMTFNDLPQIVVGKTKCNKKKSK